MPARLVGTGQVSGREKDKQAQSPTPQFSHVFSFATDFGVPQPAESLGQASADAGTTNLWVYRAKIEKGQMKKNLT